MVVQYGHRPNDAFSSGFTQRDFARACKACLAVYPYIVEDEGSANIIADKELNLPAGKGLLVWQDPHTFDPADPGDLRNKYDTQSMQMWEALHGRCVEVNVHFNETSLFWPSKSHLIFIVYLFF